jgi:CheY-like chemotaxis protein
MEAIGTLAGGIAHDFNNILSIIIGYAETIKMFDLSQDSPLISKMDEVLSASYRARDLVQQILTFCYKTEQQKHPLQIGLIVKEALKFLRSSLPSTIDIRQRIRTKEMILADPTHMHQVIVNLCTNAAHAMRESGGMLEVSLDETELDDPDVLYGAALHSQNLTRGDYLRLTVRDTGHGMDSGVIERIFEPYFTTKKQGEGTGLGLAMVQGIVHGHGGAVTVDSEPGKGSTFQVFLPKLIKEGDQPESKESSPVPFGKNECILFIDDEEHIVEIGEDALKHLGYEVVAKRSSAEALEIFREQPNIFDLVITDQTMPEMTGDMLSREILRIRPDIPIILCTGYSEKITEEKAKAAGIREFIAKPLGTKKLANVIRKVLDQRTANSE